MVELIYDMNTRDLEARVLGKRVEDVNEDWGSLTLEGGVVLEFVDTYDCCSWFKGQLKAGNLTDNVVTSVVREERDGDPYKKHYSLHILATDTRIATLDITGDECNGYYCRSITLRVRELGNR